MSTLTAHSIKPLFQALAPEEKARFVQWAKKDAHLKRKPPKIDPYENIDDIFRPENKEALASAIMTGNF